jgi:hypothetical protein
MSLAGGELMRSLAIVAALSALFVTEACAPMKPEEINARHYLNQSRFTDPGARSAMLDELPDDVEGIARVAENLTVHHNLLPYHEVPVASWSEMIRPWPPEMSSLLAVLNERGPGNLTDPRRIEDRIVSACMLESHLLAGMLRHRGIPVRMRAGYFRNVNVNPSHVLDFWEMTLRARGIERELLEKDPERWREEIRAYTQAQIDVDHRIEHWVVECWDGDRKIWRILDANTTFLEASSGLEVDYNLPRTYFEYAWEAWRTMRNAEDLDPDRYAEWPQDGRSHIRSQLLWDFFSLLNHDIAGYDTARWQGDDPTSAERRAYAFVKERSFEQLSDQELVELDLLVELLSREPTREELVAFYRDATTLRLETAELDQYSFAREEAPTASDAAAGS